METGFIDVTISDCIIRSPTARNSTPGTGLGEGGGRGLVPREPLRRGWKLRDSRQGAAGGSTLRTQKTRR